MLYLLINLIWNFTQYTIILLTIILFVVFVLEKINFLRKWSPIQKFIFPNPHCLYSVNDTNIHSITSSQWKEPIIYSKYTTLNTIENEKQKESRIVLVCHGNGCNISHLQADNNIIDGLNNSSLNSKRWYGIYPEYPGYGPNGGYTDDTIIADRCVYLLKKMQKELNVKDENIIIIGRSIGSGIASQICEKINGSIGIKALILISPFSSLDNVILDVLKPYGKYIRYLSKLLVAQRFDNLSIIKKLSMPLLLFHGNTDELIKPNHSQILFDNSNSTIKHLEYLNGNHNNISYDEIQRILINFLKTL
jgi:esterase/lipase